MPRSANDAGENLEVPTSTVGRTSYVAGTNKTGDLRATDIEIDVVVPGWSVAEYKACYADILHARRFGATFPDGANAYKFDRRNVCRDTNIRARNRKWTLLWRWCPGTLNEVFGFDMPIIQVGYL